MEMQALHQAYELCVNKINNNIKKMPEEFKAFPATTNGDYFTTDVEKQESFFAFGNWTTSFFTGMALLAFQTTGDTYYLKWTNSLYDFYYKKVFEYTKDTMHDLGFLYTPYAIASYKLTGDINQKKIALKAADELAKRFVAKAGYINAWARMFDTEDLKKLSIAIIDCMMNLPLLFWATEETGNSFYHDLAVIHADMTMNRMMREDHSVYHAYRFDPNSGAPVGGCNYCGYADESHWARGTAWAIYGFAIAYKYTRNTGYLETAKKLSYKFIENLDDSYVPAWDFRLPEHEPKNKDTSAAAIAVCGFMEILKYDSGNTRLKEYADKILYVLTDEMYTDYDVECPGILKQSNGNMTYTSFGDYFYMEALARKVKGIEAYW